MITAPIFKRPDGSYVVTLLSGGRYHVSQDTRIKIDEVEAYLAEHEDALVDEPVPEPPTQEQLDAQEMSQLLAYLASTDWYAIRYAETQVSIPDDVATERQSARGRISALRTLG